MQGLQVPKAIIKGDGRNHDGLDMLRQQAYVAAMTGRVGTILSVDNDAKTIKGREYGVLTGIVYMAPANVSGYEVCPKRTRGCSAACLFTAGQGRFPNVKQGRLRRTYTWLFRRPEFFQMLVHEIRLANKKAIREGLHLAIRLNGTSDIRYENHPVVLEDGSQYPHIFSVFEGTGIQFYDYTKRIDLERASVLADIPNYHLTFSRAETTASQQDTELALSLGMNVTVVFRNELPPTWNGYPVIDGNRHDIRFWDTLKNAGGPVVVGLPAKGPKGKADQSGFVVDWPV
jgi:hypothetical protein